MVQLLVGLFLILTSVSQVKAADKESEGIKVNGFADIQAHWVRDAPSEGFSIYDGALYLGKDFSHGKFFIDLPFAYEGTGSNNFKFGKDKAQAYLTFNGFNEVIETQVGQWDTFFGIEPLDSVDMVFTRASFISAATNAPTTFLGVGLSVKPNIDAHNQLKITGVISNPSNQGQKLGKDFEYVGQISFKNDSFRASAGGFIYKEGSAKRIYADFTLGYSHPIVSGDAELAILKDGTSAGNADETGVAALGQIVVSPVKDFQISGRLGLGRKVVGAYTKVQGTFGPQYAINEHLKLKADYTMTSTAVTEAASKINSHELMGSVSYRF